MKKIGLLMLLMGSAEASSYEACCVKNFETRTNECYSKCEVKVTSEDGDHKVLYLTVPKQSAPDPSPTPEPTPSGGGNDNQSGCRNWHIHC